MSYWISNTFSILIIINLIIIIIIEKRNRIFINSWIEVEQLFPKIIAIYFLIFKFFFFSRAQFKRNNCITLPEKSYTIDLKIFLFIIILEVSTWNGNVTNIMNDDNYPGR